MSGAGGLAEFIAARYDEAEAKARAATPGPWTAEKAVIAGIGGAMILNDNEDVTVALAETGGLPEDHPIRRAAVTNTAYIADVDPAHRLADIALKRAILAEHQPGSDGNCATCVDRNAEHPFIIDLWLPAGWPCATVRQLGTEFAGHPAYKAEWKA